MTHLGTPWQVGVFLTMLFLGLVLLLWGALVAEAKWKREWAARDASLDDADKGPLWSSDRQTALTQPKDSAIESIILAVQKGFCCPRGCVEKDAPVCLVRLAVAKALERKDGS